jgi:hypothetical protein
MQFPRQMNHGPRLALPLILSAASFGACAAEPDGPTPAEVEAAALAAFERTLAESIRRADEAAEAVARTLEPLPVMTTAEEDALRRHLNGAHVARARALGVRADDREAVDSLTAAGRLVALEDSTEHWVVRPRTDPTFVVPATVAMLAELGARFQRRLAELGLPPYRFEVTSALRTTGRQAALRRSNPNAASGASSHEFGTSVDVSYAAFAPPAATPDGILAGVPDALVPHAERIAALAFESASARKSRELGRIFSQVLREAQDEGLVLVIYERAQTVYHLTVARPLAP